MGERQQGELAELEGLGGFEFRKGGGGLVGAVSAITEDLEEGERGRFGSGG